MMSREIEMLLVTRPGSRDKNTRQSYLVSSLTCRVCDTCSSGNLGMECKMNVYVVIRGEPGYKFVVLQEHGTNDLYVFADAAPEFEYHRDLLRAFRNERGLNLRCIGGGRIRKDSVAKTIKIWDSSGDFGFEPDREVTVSAIAKAYPDYTVTSSRW